MAKDKVSVPSIQVGLNEPGIAYGGVIYSSTATMGYNGEPTKLDINVALDTRVSSTLNSGNPRDFRITKKDLDLTSPIEIKFSKASFFKNMFLTSYDITTSVGDKVMNLQYSDGSVLLDRVFVGLIHEHFEIDSQKNGVLNSVELKVKCPEKVQQNISASSYPSNQNQSNQHIADGSTYEVCSATKSVISNRKTFRTLSNATGAPNINYKVFRQDESNIWAGGYIVIGKEEFSESQCDVRDVSYSFRDLLSAIRSFGINISLSRFPNRQNIDQLTKNYSGTIRDVLQNWLNDLGATFYWDFSKTKPTIAVVNLSDRSIQDKFEKTIASIDLLDRGHGANMISGSDLVINSKQESCNLEGTFTQAFSSNLTRGPSSKQKERDFSQPVIFSCQTLNSIAASNGFIQGRAMDDFFVSMALNKYGATLREPFLIRKAVNLHSSSREVDQLAAEGYYNAAGFKGVIPLNYGPFLNDGIGRQVLAEVLGAVGLDQALTEAQQHIDLHYGEQYNLTGNSFSVFLAIVDDGLKQTYKAMESSIADEFIGKHYVLSAPAAEYFDCNPNYKILESLKTEPSSEFYGQSQHYKTPMAKFLQKIQDLRIDGLVTDGDLYKNQLYDDTNELIEQFQEECSKKFFTEDREKGFFHFERSAPWFGNSQDIQNLLNPYRLAIMSPDESGGSNVYVSDETVNRVRYDLTASYQPFMYELPALVGPVVRRAIKRINDLGLHVNTLSRANVSNELVRMMNVIDQAKFAGDKVRLVVCLKGDRDSSTTNNPYSIGDIQISATSLRRNTIEEINALQSLCERSNETLSSDVDECTLQCENDFVEEMCSSEILGQGKLNCADLANIRDSAFSTEIEPDRANQIKGLSISIKRRNTNESFYFSHINEQTKAKIYKKFDLPGNLYSDVKKGSVDAALHTIVAPSQYGHKGVLKYNRKLTVTDTGQRKVFDGLDKTRPIISPTVSSVKYQTQDITQDIVSIYNPDNRQGIIKGEIPVDVLVNLSRVISTDGDDEYLNLQSISAQNYHDLLKSNISSQQVTTPRESVVYKIYLDGSSGVSGLMRYLKQENGLESMSILADEGGYYINITFTNRPPIDPSLDVLFRMIKPQAKAVQPKMSFYRSMS